jgi:hypothetical protein
MGHIKGAKLSLDNDILGTRRAQVGDLSLDLSQSQPYLLNLKAQAAGLQGPSQHLQQQSNKKD